MGMAPSPAAADACIELCIFCQDETRKEQPSGVWHRTATVPRLSSKKKKKGKSGLSESSR
jgi:hypothetical protein